MSRFVIAFLSKEQGSFNFIVFLGCYNNIAHMGQGGEDLKKEKFMFSQSWRLEVQDEHVGGVDFL